MSCCNSNNVNSLLNRCSKSNRGNNLVNHFNKRINELENKELNLNNISSNIIPDLDQTYNLGSEEKKFKDLYLSGNTLYLGSIQLKDNGGTLEVKDSNGQNALDLTTIEEQVTKNSEDITILNNKINKNIEVTNNLLVTGNLCYQDKPVLYSNINEISSSIVVPVQSSGIYKNIGNSQITLTLDGTSETTTLESGNSKLIYASTIKLFSVQTNLPQPVEESMNTYSIVFEAPFGGVVFDGNIYTFPTNAQPWACFGSYSFSHYPLSFPNGGSITFDAYALNNTNVRFRLEYNPFPNTEPSYDTNLITINSRESQSYTIDIPSQGQNTFSSTLLYIIERDSPVTITNVVININP